MDFLVAIVYTVAMTLVTWIGWLRHYRSAMLNDQLVFLLWGFCAS